MDLWYWNAGWIPSLLAVVGNGLVIYILVRKRRKLLTTTNRFVLSLAIADLCVGASYYPGHLICYLWPPPSCNFKIRDDISVMAIFSSVTNLCAMALDRYIAIVKPLHYLSLMTVRRASLLAAAAWLIPLSVFFIPSLCASLNLFHLRMEISVIIWTTLFEFIPCVFLLLTTTRAVLTARRHCHFDTVLNTQLRYNRPCIRRTRAASSTKVIASVATIFLLCYAVEVYSSICYFTELCRPTVHLYSAVRFLVITNSAANPIAYAFLKRDIRNELRKVFCGTKMNLQRSRNESTTRV